MIRQFLIAMLSVLILPVSAQIKCSRIDNKEISRLIGMSLDRKELHKLAPKSAIRAMRHAEAEESAEADSDFIFDPVGEEKLYVMSMYSYEIMKSQFVRGTSLKSQVRYAPDGKTVYFKDMTKSLGVKTWLKGTIDGDTIRIPYGQPLAYYRGQYLVFYVPMIYDDNTGDLYPQDDYKLVVKGDSLISPNDATNGLYEASCGYVFIGDKQGALSFDIDMNMRQVEIPVIEVPENAEGQDYVYSYTTDYGNLFKRKATLKKDGRDLYMQLSASAADAYIKGTIEDDGSITVPCPQAISTDNYIFYYSLADPIRNEESGEITDFTPSTTGKGLKWDSATREVTSGKDVISADYMDGMQQCMDFVFQPAMKPYGGNVAAKPVTPRLSKIQIEPDLDKYICFYAPALDVDSNYINVDSLTYRIYVNDTVMVFRPSQYQGIQQTTTEIPYNFADNYDFFVYGEQHYVYLYGDISSVGVDVVYTVDGVKTYSDKVIYRREEKPDPEDPSSKDNDLTLADCRVKERMVRPVEQVQLVGTVRNSGKKDAAGYRLAYIYNGQRTETTVSTELAAGKEESFTSMLDHGIKSATNNIPVMLSVETIGVEDLTPTDNDTTLYFSVYDQTLCKGRVLLEEFTSESCGWCPYGAYRIKTAIDESNLGDSVIWMCHHEGYGVDWLTVDASTTYCELYGGSTFAPAWMVDRNVAYSDEAYPVFSIPSVEDVSAVLRKAMDKPCFVGISARSVMTGGNTAQITVDVDASQSFLGQSDDPRITVFVVEDSIAPKKQRSYDSHTIDAHHNALRAVLTDVWGNPLNLITTESQNLSTSLTFGYEVPQTEVLKNLKVIAFVHDYSNDVNSREVFNTAICPLDDTSSGIVSVRNGKSGVSRSGSFNLTGQRVGKDARGIVIVNGIKRLRN